MSTLRQVGVLMVTLLIGTLLRLVIPVPVPATVYGMIILFILLRAKVVKVESIEPVSNVLLANLAFLFVPAGVGMITEFKTLEGHLLAVLGIIFISNFLTLFVTGHVVQLLQKRGKKNDK